MFYPLIRVLSPHPCFILSSVFYPLIRVLSPHPCFIPSSGFILSSVCYPLIRVLSPHPYPAIRIRVLSQPPLDHAPKIHVTPIATVRFQGINAYFQRCSNAFKMQAQAQLQMAVHIEMVERVSSFPKYYVCITGSPISGCTCCHHNMYNIIYY